MSYVKSEEISEGSRATSVNHFSGADIELILRERGWLEASTTPEIDEWMRHAAEWLGVQVRCDSADEGRRALTELLSLVFEYDAAKMLENRDNQAVMALDGAKDVIRELANLVLAGGEVDSHRFSEIVAALKATFGSRGRRTFHPLRLVLAGRAGEGELDRVILLLDGAARLPFVVPVKGTRQRMVEFCAALS